jgi:hypothetical protein
MPAGDTEADQQGTDESPVDDGLQPESRTVTSDDFLLPGPSPESNEGLARWGCTWLAFSLLLMLVILAISFVCLTLSNWTGIA